MNLNQVTLAGRVCQTPELKSLNTGSMVCKFSLAINHYWKDTNGAKQEDVTFIPCVFWGKTAENIAQYVVKGQVLLVTGRLTIRSYDDKEGVKKWSTEVVGENFQFGQKPSDADTKRTGYEKSQGVPANRSSDQSDAPKDGLETIEYPEEEINPDDIPF